MPKQFINKYLPKASSVTKHRSLSWLGELLHDGNLWHLNRRSVASAVFVGIFACFMPIPLQMLLAACLAIYFHCNLPLSISLVWISNPLTYAPIFYVCYRLGLVIMGVPHDSTEFSWNVSAMGNNFALLWKPLLIGCTLSGIIFGALGYVAVRVLWRLHVQRSWLKRKANRAKQLKQKFKDGSHKLKESAKLTSRHIKSSLKPPSKE